MTGAGAEMTCRELVELVTDYLDGSLPTADRRRFEAHLRACDGCTTYLQQIRQTITVTGSLRTHHLENAGGRELLAAFRDWFRKP